MKMQPGKLLKPTEKELDLIQRIDEIYSAGLGQEFEDMVRSSIQLEKERGQVTRFDPSGTYYALLPSELPNEENRDIFRRLCISSPSEPLDVEKSSGEEFHAQLVDKLDFQRLIRALLRVVAKLLGLDREKTKDSHHRDIDEFTLG